jgi:hypothetical protein
MAVVGLNMEDTKKAVELNFHLSYGRRSRSQKT